MKWFVIAAGLALALAPLAALADVTRYLDNRAGSTNDTLNGRGLSAQQPWHTIGYAMRMLPQPNTANGNVILRIAGNGLTAYDTVPNPVNAPANGKRYFIYGGGRPSTNTDHDTTLAGNLLCDSCVRIAGVNETNTQAAWLCSTYVSIVGVRFTRNFVISNQRTLYGTAIRFGPLYTNRVMYDTLRHCIFDGSVALRGSYSGITDSRINGAQISLMDWPLGQDGYYIRRLAGPFLINDTANVLTVGPGFTGGQSTPSDNRNRTIESHCDSMRLWFGRLRFDVTTNNNPNNCFKVYNFQHIDMRDNRIVVNSHGASNRTIVWSSRDSSNGLSMQRDTIIGYGDEAKASTAIWFGQNSRACAGGAIDGNLDSSYFQAHEIAFDAISGLSITRSTFVSRGATITAITTPDSLIAGNTASHNTFVSLTQTPVQWNGYKMHTGANDRTDISFTDNLCYTFSGSASGINWGPFGAAGSTTLGVEGIRWLPQSITTNNNLYGNYNASAPSSQAIAYNDGTNRTSAPGPSPTSTWQTAVELQVAANHVDENSVYGAPQFLQPVPPGGIGSLAFTNDSTMNVRIGANSAARGVGSGGSDIGAVAYLAGLPVLQFQSDTLRTFSDSTIAAYTDSGVTIRNLGDADLTGTFSFEPLGAYWITADTASVNLAPGHSRQYVFTINDPGYTIPVGTYPIEAIITTNEVLAPTRRVRWTIARGIYVTE